MATQTLNGQVIKVKSAEGFGFICSKNLGSNVFFHRSDCTAFADITQGDNVTFCAKDTPKGKAAVNVIVVKLPTVNRLVSEFIFTRHTKPKRGRVIHSETVQTPWFCDPNKGKAYLERMAKSAGCNAVLNMQCKREVKQKDVNFFGMMHKYCGEISMVVEDVSVSSEIERKSMQSEAFSEMSCSKALAKEAGIKRQEAEVRNRNNGNGGGLILAFIGFVGFLALL